MMRRKSRAFWEFTAFVLAMLLILLIMCAGCKQFLVDFAHEVPVACGAALKEPTPAGKDKYLKAMQDTGQKVADKAGMPSVVVTEANVLDRLKATGEAADAYVPWYQQIPSTGMPWLDALIGLLSTSAGAYFLRKPLRGGLHLLTHNAKEVGHEKVAQ